MAETGQDNEKSPYLLGSLNRGLAVLDCFTQRESWSLAELAQHLQQSKATLFRVLHTLEEFGYLDKDSATARYTLGLRCYALGSAAMRQEQLRWQALPPLQDLARETGETVYVGILYDGDAVCVQIVDGTQVVRMHSFVGKRSPAHASALGKVLLAQLPEADLAEFIAQHPLKRFTPTTIATPKALRSELARIRADGHALDREEMELGLRCIGVPITDHTGRITATLALSAPASRMDAARTEALLPRLKAAAQRISRMLGAPGIAA